MCVRDHRFLVVLEGLAGLLVGADLLAALALDVALLHLLQEGVGPAQPPQHRVRRVRRQENWGTNGGWGDGCQTGGNNVNGSKRRLGKGKDGNRGERDNGEDVCVCGGG